VTNEQYVRYWMTGAEEDFASMQRIFQAGEYVWALFIGHLVIEKLLKACCARSMGKETPRVHNLLWLARTAGIELTPDQRKRLSRLNLFNARTRYADWKNEFRRTATRDYAEGEIEAMKEVREWVLQLLSQRSNP
jgi:HEPN domain-containing protein